MSAKDKSAVISGMGVGMSFITNVLKKAQERGITNDELYEVMGKNDGETLAEKVVSAMLEERGKAGTVFRVKSNYDLTIEAAIRAGKYGWKNDNITSKNFSTNRTGEQEVEVRLVHFDYNISSDDAIKALDKLGLRPAELHELLALGAQYPDLQRQFPIVALGSVCRLLGDRRVPVLWYGTGGRGLDLDYWDGGWDPGDRFAAVCK